jgi:hypothetical protein
LINVRMTSSAQSVVRRLVDGAFIVPQRGVLGDEHPDTLVSMNDFARMRWDMQGPAKALQGI